jgi:TolB protein
MQVHGSGQAVVPNWSPDGDRVLITSDRTGNISIYVVDLDGSNLKRLTNNPHQNDNAVWSPDARRIAFSSDQERQK